MSLITEMFNSIKQIFQKKQDAPVFLPLQFTESARDKINSQIASRPVGSESMFEIQIEFRGNSVRFKTGFTKKEICNTIYTYPVPLQINRWEEEFLRNCTIDFNSDNGLFEIYPDVKVTVENTPNPKILKFFINRILIHEKSESKFISIDKSSGTDTIFIFKSIFSKNYIDSLYIENYFISIEFSENPTHKMEEEVADILLKYYTDSGYTFGIQNGRLHSYIPGPDNQL